MSRPRALARLLAAFLIGAALPFAAERAAALLVVEPFRPGPVRLWVADRDGGRVVGLDRDLFEAAHRPCAAPLSVAARADGGAWVLDVAGGGGPDARRLLRLDARGAPRLALDLPRASALAALDGEDALVLAAAAAPEPERVLRVDEWGSVTFERALPGARAVAGRASRVAVGFADGRVALYDLDHGGVLAAEGAAGAPVTDVAPGTRGGWWFLTGGAEPRLHLFDAALAPRWDHAPGLDAPRLAAVPEEEQAWLVSASAPAAVRCGPLGRVEVAALALPHAGLGRAAARPGGGVVLVSPGAVLVLDARGALERTQGGFDFAVSVSLVP